ASSGATTSSQPASCRCSWPSSPGAAPARVCMSSSGAISIGEHSVWYGARCLGPLHAPRPAAARRVNPCLSFERSFHGVKQLRSDHVSATRHSKGGARKSSRLIRVLYLLKILVTLPEGSWRRGYRVPGISRRLRADQKRAAQKCCISLR